MPKVNYEKQPFRLCRWNSIDYKRKGREDMYWCSDAEEYVEEDRCMKCFCNNWFNICSTCKKQILKTELIYVFLPEFKLGYICNDCYDGEEKVQKKPSKTERYIIFDIKKWIKLNKEE